ncbi:D-alanyl-D-alanine carboxypeptidase [Candidatus Saccharibacteria bacterium]|nr:D-alanyl-D-alanine carboxypeptidase [Candidatus Saccharibacteria bacterium]
MLLVALALLISIIQLTVAPNALLQSISSNLNHSSAITKESRIGYVNTPYVTMPELKTGALPYASSAKAAIIYDVGSGKTLYEKSPTESIPIASLTKLMTALVIMQNHSPNEIVTIPKGLPVLGSADQKIGVVEGEKFKLSELMQALLVYSANDVANSLAVWDSGSIDGFTNKMNGYAKQWGLENSHYTNPTGLDETNHQSSTKDLLSLSTILLHNATFRKIVNTQKTTIHSEAQKPYTLTTTNHDLTVPYIYGIKTGLTDNAGQCLILLAQKGNHEIITVVLNSPDRFQESKNMVDYAFSNYLWK